MTDAQIDQLISRFASPSAPPPSAAATLAPPLALDDLARLFDHTALKPDTTEDAIHRLCDEARTYGFASVCVNPCYVSLAAEALADTDVAVCTVVGFPLGAMLSATKAAEARHVLREGATEVDMVLNVGLLKSEQYDRVEQDLRAVVEAVRDEHADALVKVILETALLTDEEKVIACVLAQNAGADFVKTSTGFSRGGATVEDVALMHRVVGGQLGVKASGGVGSVAEARAMVDAGASRIGASGSVAIMQELEAEGSA
ncbi:MAG: deoxyribose-phosphate aldolase [Bacteroidetes bacterium]|jgi:deoxyribose-phosphate aldolase|nr:deoxyribose-phosphate aldolase [Bacteroidota bacterium]